MAPTTLNATRLKPAVAESLARRVPTSRQVPPHFQRTTLGGDDIGRSKPTGFDQRCPT